MNKVAFFDFCETLANFQTADKFVFYSYKLLSGKDIKRSSLMFKLIHFADIFTRWHFNLNKRYILWHLRGYSESDIIKAAELYYSEIVEPNLIPDTITLLKKKVANGDKVVLVSGGYDVYLRYFAKKFSVSGIISTRIKFEKGVCKGLFWGRDCLGHNKTILLERYYPDAKENSEGFSDSKSDLPFLKWVACGYVISRNKTQLWAKDNNLKEIIWIEKQD